MTLTKVEVVYFIISNNIFSFGYSIRLFDHSVIRFTNEMRYIRIINVISYLYWVLPGRRQGKYVSSNYYSRTLYSYLHQLVFITVATLLVEIFQNFCQTFQAGRCLIFLKVKSYQNLRKILHSHCASCFTLYPGNSRFFTGYFFTGTALLCQPNLASSTIYLD